MVVVLHFLSVLKQQIEFVQIAKLVFTKIPILIQVFLVKPALLLVVSAPNLLLVLQQQPIERVPNVNLVPIKIPNHIQVLLVNHALLRVVMVLNFLSVQQ